ncbi:MAG: hypothetical protein SCM11_13560 [Bacillota bacterium]|nr:hypothetical protein [Bacillota bacterium]
MAKEVILMQSGNRKVMFWSVAILVLMVLVVVAALLLTRRPEHQSFSIYLVKDSDRQTSAETPLADLVLEEAPLITDEDLTAYRWADHTLMLTDKDAVEGRLPSVPTNGLPFVVVVNGERIYYGAFWASYSSQSTDLPVIDIIFDYWQIKPGYPWDHVLDPDVRNDRRIRDALSALGKLD